MQTDATFKSVLLFILEGMALGDKAVVYDAFNLSQVAELEIPRNKLYEHNSRARVQHLKTEIAGLKQFFLKRPNHPTKLEFAINLPQFLLLLGQQPSAENQSRKVILIGSPIYRSVTESTFDEDEAYPSDQCLLVSEKESVWGTVNRKNLLTGASVHFAYVQNCFVNELHREMLGRFYSLYIRQMGGVLSTFTPDPNLAFSRAKENGQSEFISAHIDPNDSKVEMHPVVKREIPLRVAEAKRVLPRPPANSPQTAPAAQQSAPVIPVVETNIVQVASVTPEPNLVTGIGIRWEANGCDFDLWVKPTPNSPELYYGNKHGPEGRFFNDFRNRNNDLDDELVELTKPVNLKELKCWVNFYSGRSKHPCGSVIVYSKGRIYRSEFAFKSTQGNRGRDSATKIGDCWTTIPVAEIVGVTP